MPVRLHLVPAEEVTLSGTVYRGPKYFWWRFDPDPPALIQNTGGRAKSMLDYGLEPAFLVGCNLTTQEIADLAAQSDVVAVPANLDNTVGSNLATVQARLEAFNVPANWVASSMTYRQVLRGVIAIFRIADRLSGEPYNYARLVPQGVNLSTAYADMPSPWREHLVEVVDGFGYSRAGLGNQSTLRDLMEAVAQQGVPAELFGIPI